MLTIAMLQLNLTVGDISGNADRIATAVERAAEAGAELCLTSELALIGYPPRDLLQYCDLVHKTRDAVDKLAFRLRYLPPLILGALDHNLTCCDTAVYNCAFVLEANQVAARYSKQLIRTYTTCEECRCIKPNTGLGVVQAVGLTLGLIIGEDILNDKDCQSCRSSLTNLLKPTFGYHSLDAIINLSASPFVIGKQAKRETILSAISRMCGIPLFYINQVGGNDDLIFDGHSMTFDGYGQLRARGIGFAEDLVLVRLDLTAPRTAIRPINENGMAKDNLSPPAEAWQALVLGTRDYTTKCGFSRVMLGLSGGIDSSLVAAIAATALGPEQVLGVLMPSPYSSEDSIKDALTLANNLKIATCTLHIADCMQAFDKTLAPVFSGYPPDLTEENLQARIRGSLLMAISNKFNALLLSTGNKSELAVGYCTIYGDMCGGLAVIADVPKTLVYDICRYLNTIRENTIPTKVLAKAPSAELRINQQDQDSLPPYEILDAILEQHIENRATYAKLTADGFDQDAVSKILHLVRTAEFKRRQAAPGLKITDRSFGADWHMPLACSISSLQTTFPSISPR